AREHVPARRVADPDDPARGAERHVAGRASGERAGQVVERRVRLAVEHVAEQRDADRVRPPSGAVEHEGRRGPPGQAVARAGPREQRARKEDAPDVVVARRGQPGAEAEKLGRHCGGGGRIVGPARARELTGAGRRAVQRERRRDAREQRAEAVGPADLRERRDKVAATGRERSRRARAARPGGGRPRARGAAIDLDRAAGSGKRGGREHRARVHRRARVPEPDDLVARGEVDGFTEHGEHARHALGAAQRESRLPAERGQQDHAPTLPRAANLYAMRLRYPAVLIAVLAALGAVNAPGAETIQEFLGRHWRRPLVPQGPPPARFSPLEASLRPEACGSCHPAQLADWATSLHARSMGPGVVGQLVEMLESTYAEWKASRFAREGVQCQDCHMPDRRHLWRGIHDPAMVRLGLTIVARTGASRYRAGDTISVTLSVENTRVGHAFPTYVTPRVVLSAELVDQAGDVVAGSREERVIGRNMTLDLARELSS